MARTVHHTDHAHHGRPHNDPGPGFCASTPLFGASRTLYDLRYSAAELARATAEGRRPQPTRIRATFRPFTTPAAFRGPGAGEEARLARRSARSTDRTWLRTARTLLAADPTTDLDDPPDLRTRHTALWNAW